LHRRDKTVASCRRPVGRRVAAVAFLCHLTLAAWPCSAQDLPDRLKGHGGPIKAITISPDGNQALTASFDYSIIHWDISGRTAQILHRFIGHEAAVNDVAFVPDSEHIVSVSDDGSLGIWDLREGRLLTRIGGGEGKAVSVAVSADGAKAAVARWNRTATVYDLHEQNGIVRLTGHKGNVNAVLFSADGMRVYTAGHDGQIIEWDSGSGALIRSIYRHGWGINSIAFIDDNRLLFGALDGSAGVVGLAEADPLMPLARSEYPILSVKVSPDGTQLAYGDGEGAIEVFKTDTAKRIADGPVTYGPVWDFAFVPGTEQIYHVGLDDFASRWQVIPREMVPLRSTFPRRFQVMESDDPGELEFYRKCSVCHTLTPDGGNRAGPTLHGLFGRRAGSVPDYEYSPALRNSEIVWTEETVGMLFDHGPDVVVPGTKMPIQRLKSVEHRDALIRFLKKATGSIE
jgi:cytochrome c